MVGERKLDVMVEVLLRSVVNDWWKPKLGVTGDTSGEELGVVAVEKEGAVEVVDAVTEGTEDLVDAE